MNPNETPEQAAVNNQPQTIPSEPSASTPTPQPTPVAPQPVTGAQGSKAMAVWSLVLAIIAFLIGIFFFISAPMALIALVLGIVVLAKKRAGKGLAIAGVIISGIALLSLPFTMAIFFTAYNGVQEKAQQSAQQAQ